MSTIQQQLEAVGHQLTVDGIEFNAEFYEGDHDGYYFLIGRKKVQIFWELETSGQTQFNKWILKYGAVFGGTPLDVCFTAPTIEAACLEALRLCRERVRELAKGLGMLPMEADINTSAEISANIESPSVQALAELYFKKGANYVLNFNQSTGENK